MISTYLRLIADGLLLSCRMFTNIFNKRTISLRWVLRWNIVRFVTRRITASGCARFQQHRGKIEKSQSHFWEKSASVTARLVICNERATLRHTSFDDHSAYGHQWANAKKVSAQSSRKGVGRPHWAHVQLGTDQRQWRCWGGFAIVVSILNNGRSNMFTNWFALGLLLRCFRWLTRRFRNTLSRSRFQFCLRRYHVFKCFSAFNNHWRRQHHWPRSGLDGRHDDEWTDFISLCQRVVYG